MLGVQYPEIPRGQDKLQDKVRFTPRTVRFTRQDKGPGQLSGQVRFRSDSGPIQVKDKHPQDRGRTRQGADKTAPGQGQTQVRLTPRTVPGQAQDTARTRVRLGRLTKRQGRTGIESKENPISSISGKKRSGCRAGYLGPGPGA